MSALLARRRSLTGETWEKNPRNTDDLDDEASRDRHRRMMAAIAQRIAFLVARIHGRKP